uniref:U6 snRNA-associated Sm-like protein LSm5 n=1 Tax=Buteo japonicus TaxID=224669 RepID=A0A8C0HI48_9AVES
MRSAAAAPGLFLFPELVDRCTGSLVGTLLGFDDSITPEGRRITKLDQILLNGNNITMVSHREED